MSDKHTAAERSAQQAAFEKGNEPLPSVYEAVAFMANEWVWRMSKEVSSSQDKDVSLAGGESRRQQQGMLASSWHMPGHYVILTLRPSPLLLPPQVCALCSCTILPDQPLAYPISAGPAPSRSPSRSAGGVAAAAGASTTPRGLVAKAVLAGGLATSADASGEDTIEQVRVYCSHCMRVANRPPVLNAAGGLPSPLP